MLDVKPEPVGAVIVISPVGVVQVGWVVTEAVGTEGVVGCGLIVVTVAGDTQPPAFLAVTLYVPAGTKLKVPDVFEYVVPSMLYLMPVPVGSDIVIAPLANVQVGCVSLTVGAAGIAGCGAIVTLVAAETQPPLLFAVTP